MLDGSRIIQGFVGLQNKNLAIPLLAKGVVTSTDKYANDPTGFYVQVYLDLRRR